MPKMRAAQVTSANGPIQIVEPEIGRGPRRSGRGPGRSGICHSDSFASPKRRTLARIQYPRVPGHEVAGIIDAVGADVTGWNVGDRVGVGWHGGHCGHCDSCRRGSFVLCQLAGQIPGISYDGGHADYMVAPAVALARIPEGLSAAEAAPLMCAGVTTFNSLRHAGARPGDLVAVLGIGGLGHLGVQFAAKAGFRTVAIARGKDKDALARQLGAQHYVDSETQDPAQELARLGGARVVLATVTSGKAMTAVLGGLGIDGKLVVLGAAHEPLEVPPLLLISGRRSVVGWPSGSSVDSQDTMAFCAQTGVRSMNELFPLRRAAEAYDRMMSGKARFRVVLTTEA
jgi:D-arabinose 1-dehydrogenase-like Zn-dependent alcohol dehydrogenase